MFFYKPSRLLSCQHFRVPAVIFDYTFFSLPHTWRVSLVNPGPCWSARFDSCTWQHSEHVGNFPEGGKGCSVARWLTCKSSDQRTRIGGDLFRFIFWPHQTLQLGFSVVTRFSAIFFLAEKGYAAMSRFVLIPLNSEDLFHRFARYGMASNISYYLPYH